MDPRPALFSSWPCSHQRTGLFRLAAFGLLALCAIANAAPPSLMEKLNRGVVAVRTGPLQTYVGWRMLGTDPADIAFNLYRVQGAAEPVKLNAAPLTVTTDFVDTLLNFLEPTTYVVKPVINGEEQPESGSFTLPANAPLQQFLSIPIQIPPPFVAPNNISYSYSANDCSVGDLDGDGEFEIILKWDPSNSGLGDTNATGWSSPCIVDAYKLDGTRLWRINLGINIRAGSHYTQLIVYDLDGDGRAEIAMKTADGTVDGQGNVIGDPAADWRARDTANLGRILTGPEYFTIFDGLTGAALATTNYPSRDPINGWGGVGGNGNNDSIGTRADRPIVNVAYLDGVRPSLIMGRGMYGRTLVGAWDWRNGQLTQRWVFDSALPPWRNHPVTYPYPANLQPLLSTFSGQGNHHNFVGDFDGDGKDEICVGAMTIDDDGRGLYSTGLRHGDALHIGDLIPARPGLEVYGIHENEGQTIAYGTPGAAMFDAATGEIIWSTGPGADVGRGVAADIDPRYPGAEAWGAPGGLRRGDTGEVISMTVPNSTNFKVWWDADFLRELEDGTTISKWNPSAGTTTALLAASGVSSNNGTKSTPALAADILGDWREEVIWRTSDNTALRIYTTTIPATNRFWTFLHDRKYRTAVAWQNVNYNQPTDPSFFVGADMPPQPPANIITELDTVPPVLTLPANITVEATSSAGAAVDFSASAHDAISGPAPVTYSHAPGSTFPLGTTSVVVTATDAYGNRATGSFSVTVRDTTAPTIESATATPDTLTSSDHKMVPVTLTVRAMDVVDGAPHARITGVTSNEPENGTGDGDTAPDWRITGDLTVELRAERGAQGTGRVYTISVQVSDASQNTATTMVRVVVPKP